MDNRQVQIPLELAKGIYQFIAVYGGRPKLEKMKRQLKEAIDLAESTNKDSLPVQGGRVCRCTDGKFGKSTAICGAFERLSFEQPERCLKCGHHEACHEAEG